MRDGWWTFKKLCTEFGLGDSVAVIANYTAAPYRATSVCLGACEHVAWERRECSRACRAETERDDY